VDTGVEGSGDAIAAALTGIGLDFPAVAHVILTHNHGDHAGSAADVLDRAADAIGYAGAEDIAGVTAPRALTPVQDGDSVFDLQIVTVPGHTAGSIAVLDPAAGGILVAGDALGTSGGAPTLPGAQFTADMDQAKASVVKLGGLTFETLLVGHGEPIESGAAQQVAALGAAG
jgi:glyoxylase-like metal-dependent hydrolase (beta-lactamase superfamily II)